jgi:hypothetical protein
VWGSPRQSLTSLPSTSLWIKAVTKQTLNNYIIIFYGLKRTHPELAGLTSQFNFPGRGRKETPVADTKGIVSKMMRSESYYADVVL